MKLTHMRPDQIKRAAADGLPLILGCGVMEYHGPHLPVGVDYLIASSVVEQVERRIPGACVLAPGLPFGPTGQWAGGPEDGEAHLDALPLFHYVKPIFDRFLRMGFQRICVCQHHQNWAGAQQGVLRLAAAELANEHGHEQAGPGWGRLPRGERPEVFGRIEVHGAAAFATDEQGEPLKIAWGHAGYGETEYIRAVFPETVDMKALSTMDPLPPWLEQSHTADGTQGKDWFEQCVTGWIDALSK